MQVEVEELRSLVRRLHVHFDVEPELEIRDGARVRVGTIVRLWGVHARGARALPGCPRCHEIITQLKMILQRALDGDKVPVAVEPFRPALYESRVVPNADEVALAIRVVPANGVSTGNAGAAEERWLKALRGRFRDLGIPER